MKDLIVNSLELIAKIAIIMLVVMGFLTGMTTGKLWYAVAGASIAFVISVALFGVVFVLLDINDNLRAMRRHFAEADELAAEREQD